MHVCVCAYVRTSMQVCSLASMCVRMCTCRTGICPHTCYLVQQEWHLVPSTSRLRGTHGTGGTGLALVARLVRRARGLSRGRRGIGHIRAHLWQACTCGTGVAVVARLVARGPPGRHGLSRGRRGMWHAHAHLWQAWHLVRSTSLLRGRHGTYGPGLSKPRGDCCHVRCGCFDATCEETTLSISKAPVADRLFP